MYKLSFFRNGNIAIKDNYGNTCAVAEPDNNKAHVIYRNKTIPISDIQWIFKSNGYNKITFKY